MQAKISVSLLQATVAHSLRGIIQYITRFNTLNILDRQRSNLIGWF